MANSVGLSGCLSHTATERATERATKGYFHKALFDNP